MIKVLYKTSYSSPGLKGHITKMHSKAKQIIENMEVINHSMESEINVEAKKVVDLILNEIIEIDDNEESLEDITLEERCDTESGNSDKKYTNKCES